MARSLRRDPSAALLRMTRSGPEPDRAVLEQPGARKAFTLSFVESLRPGTRGAGLEAQLYARPWGFASRTSRQRSSSIRASWT